MREVKNTKNKIELMGEDDMFDPHQFITLGTV